MIRLECLADPHAQVSPDPGDGTLESRDTKAPNEKGAAEELALQDFKR